MLTYQDCLGLSELTEDEILAIAEHEHLPPIIALELGEYLAHLPDGTPVIRKMIVEDIQSAARSGDRERERKLKAVLRHFVETHPENVSEAKSAGN